MKFTRVPVSVCWCFFSNPKGGRLLLLRGTRTEVQQHQSCRGLSQFPKKLPLEYPTRVQARIELLETLFPPLEMETETSAHTLSTQQVFVKNSFHLLRVHEQQPPYLYILILRPPCHGATPPRGRIKEKPRNIVEGF